MLQIDFLPETPERFADRFWPDQELVVYSPRGAGKRGTIVAESAALAAIHQYFDAYRAATFQLKWALRFLALALVLILVKIGGVVSLGGVVSISLLVSLMLFAIFGMNVRLKLLRFTLTRQYLQGPAREGLSRQERIEQGYAFGLGGIAIIAVVFPLAACVSFAVHSAILHLEMQVSRWVGPAVLVAVLLGTSLLRRIWAGD